MQLLIMWLFMICETKNTICINLYKLVPPIKKKGSSDKI